jgi:hypothetical protein
MSDIADPPQASDPAYGCKADAPPRVAIFRAWQRRRCAVARSRAAARAHGHDGRRYGEDGDVNDNVVSSNRWTTGGNVGSCF